MERLLVLSEDIGQWRSIATSLEHIGEPSPYYAQTLEEAVTLQKETGATCVLFQRDLATTFEGFFCHFPLRSIWFIPLARARDDGDIIDAINSHRSCYYLFEPFGPEQIAMALSCLRAAQIEAHLYE